MIPYKYFLTAVFLLFLLFVQINAAYASRYKIEVKQINPDGWAYNTECESGQTMCHVFMGIKPSNTSDITSDIELDVGVFIKDQTAHFQFRDGNDYLFMDQNRNILSVSVEDKTPQINTIKLYRPSSLLNNDPVNSQAQFPVFRPLENMFAELQITIETLQ